MNVRTFGLAIALALVVLIALGQSVTNSTPLTRFEYLPHPRDMVKLQDGVPYVVPVEKILVLTGLGSASINEASALFSSMVLRSKQRMLDPDSVGRPV